MSEAIMIRVTPQDFDRWIAEHDGARVHRLDYGITDGPVYRDREDPNTVLIHLDVEDMERARGWFQDQRFKEAVGRAGPVRREIFFAKPKQ